MAIRHVFHSHHGSMDQQTEKTIYLVDDDEDDRFFIGSAVRQILEHANVIEFDNGPEFLQLIVNDERSKGPALVLMDINMPRMSGIEVISALKSNAGCKHLPILAISTATDTRLIDKIIATGASGYFSKPGTLDEIRQLAVDIKNFYGQHYPAAS
jgi:response regulator RpfG family c-di-GMP phosphodiesterase